MLFAEERSAEAAATGVEHVRRLFATPRAPGVQLAVQALGIAADQATGDNHRDGLRQDPLSGLQP